MEPQEQQVEVCIGRDRAGSEISETRYVDEQEIYDQVRALVKRRWSFEPSDFIRYCPEGVGLEEKLRVSILHQGFRKALIDAMDKECESTDAVLGGLVRKLVEANFREEAMEDCALRRREIEPDLGD